MVGAARTPEQARPRITSHLGGLPAMTRSLAAPRGGRIPYERSVSIAVASVALLIAARQIIDLLVNWGGYYGFADDFTLSIAAADRWLHGGGFYYSFQLTGPYTVWPWAELYPPPALLLYLPWLVLPAFLWWLVPIAVTAWVVVAWRPRPLAWAGICVCLAWPTTIALVYWGNSGMWFVAALAAATRFGWPAALLFVKVGLAPCAIVGIWRRSWWVALAGVGLTSIAFLPMWPDYFTAMRNLVTDGPWFLYSISSVPTMMIPVVAWLGSGRRLSRAVVTPVSVDTAGGSQTRIGAAG
jgi:hypothetical protein